LRTQLGVEKETCYDEKKVENRLRVARIRWRPSQEWGGEDEAAIVPGVQDVGSPASHSRDALGLLRKGVSRRRKQGRKMACGNAGLG